MNNNRLASLCFVVALVFAPLPAQAQSLPARMAALEAAVAALQSGQTALQAADTSLQNNINAEAAARAAADTTLQTNINNEAAARAAADTTLDARVAKQESGQFGEADLVGTYAIQILGIEMQGAPARISTETSVATISLNAGGTVGGTSTDGRCTLQQGAPWFVTCDPIAGPEVIPPGALSWTVENGTLVISEPGDEVFRATIGAGGRILVAGGTSTVVGSWSNIVVMIRLPNP